jgi:hypothetical protein
LENCFSPLINYQDQYQKSKASGSAPELPKFHESLHLGKTFEGLEGMPVTRFRA